MYSTSSSFTVGRSGLSIGGLPANPASVMTCACTLPPRCATVASQTCPSQVRPGTKNARSDVRTTRTLHQSGSAQDVGERCDQQARAAGLAPHAAVTGPGLGAIVVAGMELAIVDPQLAVEQVQLFHARVAVRRI